MNPLRQKRASRRVVLGSLLVATLAIATGCESRQRTRCERCGMYTDLSPGFASQAGARRYDTPKCLWRDILDGKAARADAEVTEYYTQQAIAAEAARYVVDSDILGPMGADLIPVAPGDAARFAQEHGGRVVEAEAIDARLLAGL